MENNKHPDPNIDFPINNIARLVFLKNIVKNPLITIGDYTYYDDPEDVFNFEKNVLYSFDFIADKLIIGSFCQIATGIKFIMNGANHPMTGFSTYPFKIFGLSWANSSLESVNKGNILVGNDVWIGNSAVIMAGVKIGDGAIIAANSVVVKNVEPYSIVGGNPAREIRKRFSDEIIACLLKIKWWNWPVEKISENLDLLTLGDIERLISLK